MKNFILFFGWFLLLITACNFPKLELKESNKSFTERETAHQHNFPKPIDYVSDYEQVFTEKQRAELNKFLRLYDIQTTNEIAVVSVDSLGEFQNLADYTNDLGNYWGVGKKDKDNGLILSFSTKLKTVRISTGLGTENFVTDAECQKIIDSVIVPEFKKENYFEGVKNGVDAIVERWE